LLIATVANIGQPSRDRKLLADVRELSGLIHQGSLISAGEPLCTQWKLIACLAREANISLDCRNLQPFYLTSRDYPVPDSIASIYQEVNLSLYGFVLLVKNP
jgi:hypothetical protein